MSFISSIKEFIDILQGKDTRPYCDQLITDQSDQKIKTTPFRKNSNFGKLIQIYEEIYPLDRDIKLDFLSKIQAKHFHEKRLFWGEDRVGYSYKIHPYQGSWVRDDYPKLFIDMGEISLLLEYVHFIDECLCGTYFHMRTRKFWMSNLLISFKHDFDGSYLYKNELSDSWKTIKTLQDLEEFRSVILELCVEKYEQLGNLLNNSYKVLKTDSPRSRCKLDQLKKEISEMIEENIHDPCRYSALSRGSHKYRPDGFPAFPRSEPHDDYVHETKGMYKKEEESYYAKDLEYIPF